MLHKLDEASSCSEGDGGDTREGDRIVSDSISVKAETKGEILSGRVQVRRDKYDDDDDEVKKPPELHPVLLSQRVRDGERVHLLFLFLRVLAVLNDFTIYRAHAYLLVFNV